MIRGAILIISIPFFLAPLAYLLHRWKVAAWLAALGASSGAYLCFRWLLDRSVVFTGHPMAMDKPVTLLGTQLALGQWEALALGTLFALATLLFLLSALLPSPSFLPSLGLVSLGAVSTAMTVRPPVWNVFFLIVSALSLLPALYENPSWRREQSPLPEMKGGVSAPVSLILVSLLVFLLSLVGDLNPIAYLIPLGCLVLLGPFPLHQWVSRLATEASPLAAAFLLTVFRGTALALMMALPARTGMAFEFPSIVKVISLASMLWGGIMCAFSRRGESVMGYAAVADTGVILGLLWWGRSEGVALAFWYFLASSLGLIAFSAGLTVAEDAFAEEEAPLGGRLFVALPLLLLGGLSLAGLPLTPGFTAHWVAYRSLSPQEPGLASAMLLAGFGIILGCIRVLTSYPRVQAWRVQDIRPSELLALLLAIALFMGLEFNPGVFQTLLKDTIRLLGVISGTGVG